MDLLPPTPTLFSVSSSQPNPSINPNPNHDHFLKQKLLKHGVTPTPKILHALRKKHLQKTLRSKKSQLSQPQPNSDRTSYFDTVKSEYKSVSEHIEAQLNGKPWERNTKGVGLLKEGGKLKEEYLDELFDVLYDRNQRLKLILDDDDDVEEEEVIEGRGRRRVVKLRENVSEDEKINFLVKRLSDTNLSIQDWKFSRVMKQSGITFTEMHLLRIVERLGKLGKWKLAMYVVDWVYSQKEYRYHKSRFVYTKLLSVLGNARKPKEAQQIFNMMLEDGKLYPDMAVYHSIAVTLGQAGLLNELITIIEYMKQKPSKRIKNMKLRNWDPCLEPDIIIYNAVLNACVSRCQWKGVSWVLQEMRNNGIKPTETTYGLAMEVMMNSGKYELVHKHFETMRRGGMATKALSYKVLVKTFHKENKVDEAIEAVRDMERRGVVGTAGVYYELACCLCNKGRWQDALVEIEKLRRLSHPKPLEVTFTGMILSSLEGGHPGNCISIFSEMKKHCAPDIGVINAMLKVHSKTDNFESARELFESIRNPFSGHNNKSIVPDVFTYTSMLDASASAQHWEYFEFVYKEMTLQGIPINQSRHARLLVAASRSGKWHLLEHAIDSILEAGEIPCTSLFKEIVCQTIYLRHFEKTIIFLNSMAHASLQVKESQWIDVFKRNKDRLDKEGMLNFLSHLDSTTDLVMEDPVPNFIKAAKLYALTACDNTLLLHAPLKDSLFEDVWSKNVHNESIDVKDVITENSDSSTSNTYLELLGKNIESSFLKVAPSASDILETWKAERINDGGFQCVPTFVYASNFYQERAKLWEHLLMNASIIELHG